MSKTAARRAAALKAQAAIAAYLAEATNLWPDDDHTVRAALAVVTKDAVT